MRPLCDCCLHIYAPGRDRHVPATYMWISRVGNKIPLCVSCCASWRANAVEDPDLQAARIYSLSEVA